MTFETFKSLIKTKFANIWIDQMNPMEFFDNSMYGFFYSDFKIRFSPRETIYVGIKYLTKTNVWSLNLRFGSSTQVESRGHFDFKVALDDAIAQAGIEYEKYNKQKLNEMEMILDV